MHILIVEDEPQMAGLLTRGLEEESYQVSVARDGRAALELSAVQAFDVILARRDAAPDGRPRGGQAVAWPRRGDSRPDVDRARCPRRYRERPRCRRR